VRKLGRFWPIFLALAALLLVLAAACGGEEEKGTPTATSTAAATTTRTAVATATPYSFEVFVPAADEKRARWILGLPAQPDEPGGAAS